MLHPPDRVDDRTETTEGALEPLMEAAFTDPIWNDACEPDDVRNAEGVRIASLRFLAELVDEPPYPSPFSIRNFRSISQASSGVKLPPPATA